MKRGDKFTISKQIGNVLLQRPTGNIAEIKGFLGSNVLFAIGSVQYVLPVEIFKKYIINSIENRKYSKPRLAKIKKTPPMVIEEDKIKVDDDTVDVVPKPTQPSKPVEPDNMPSQPSEPASEQPKPADSAPNQPDIYDDLYDDMDEYI